VTDVRHGEEQHQHGRRDEGAVDGVLPGLPHVHGHEHRVGELLSGGEPREHRGVPVQAAEESRGGGRDGDHRGGEGRRPRT